MPSCAAADILGSLVKDCASWKILIARSQSPLKRARSAFSIIVIGNGVGVGVGVEVAVGVGVWLGVAVGPGGSAPGSLQLKIESITSKTTNPNFVVVLLINAIIFDLIIRVNLASNLPPC